MAQLARHEVSVELGLCDQEVEFPLLALGLEQLDVQLPLLLLLLLLGLGPLPLLALVPPPVRLHLTGQPLGAPERFLNDNHSLLKARPQKQNH